jgi:hypothetical protein
VALTAIAAMSAFAEQSPTVAPQPDAPVTQQDILATCGSCHEVPPGGYSAARGLARVVRADGERSRFGERGGLAATPGGQRRQIAKLAKFGIRSGTRRTTIIDLTGLFRQLASNGKSVAVVHPVMLGQEASMASAQQDHLKTRRHPACVATRQLQANGADLVLGKGRHCELAPLAAAGSAGMIDRDVVTARREYAEHLGVALDGTTTGEIADAPHAIHARHAADGNVAGMTGAVHPIPSDACW